MRRNRKQTKIVAFLLMFSLVITWFSLLYVFYSMGTPVSQKIFSLLLLASPLVIVFIDRPTIFMDLANTLLDTISIIIMKIFELINKYIRVKQLPKIKKVIREREQRK